MRKYEYKFLYQVRPCDFSGEYKAEWVGWFDGDGKISGTAADTLRYFGEFGWLLCDKQDRHMVLAREVED